VYKVLDNGDYRVVTTKRLRLEEIHVYWAAACSCHGFGCGGIDAKCLNLARANPIRGVLCQSHVLIHIALHVGKNGRPASPREEDVARPDLLAPL
jgi:uncharacterized protein YlaI